MHLGTNFSDVQSQGQAVIDSAAAIGSEMSPKLSVLTVDVFNKVLG